MSLVGNCFPDGLVLLLPDSKESHKGPLREAMWYEKIQPISILNLFSLDEADIAELGAYIESAEEGDTIANQGVKLDHLIIPLTTTFRIEVRQDSIDQKIGDITIGRSVSLYCYLRGIPLNYSCRANQSGEFLKIPKTVFDKFLQANPNVKNYLVKVTEDSEIRNIAKDWIQAGIDKELVFRLIDKMLLNSAEPQVFLSHKGQPALHSFFLIEGKFLVHDSQNQKKSWIMPLKSWHFFSESLNSELNNYSLATADKSRYYNISAEDLLHINQQYPEAFSQLQKYLLEGSEFPKADESDVDVELDDLFKDAVVKNTWRFNYPAIKQNDQMDCGPACLAMVSEYFGRKLSIQFWRSKLSTDKNGTSLYDLAVTTERTGFISHCLEVTKLKDVDRFLLPFIILRNYHYLVVYKVKAKTAIIGDPAYGIREIEISEVEKGMEPVGLFLKPNSDFYLLSHSPSPWTHYLKLFSGLEKEMSLAFICSLMGVAFSIVPPLISQFSLDEVLAQKDTDMLWVLMIACVAVTLISNFTSWAKNYYFIYIMNKFNFRSTSVFIQKMFSLPYSFFSSRHVGDFTHRLSEMTQLRTFVTSTLFKVSLNLISLILYSVVLLTINFKIALLVMAFLPAMLIIPMLFAKRLDREFQKIFTKSSEQSSLLTDLIEGISVIKSAGAEISSRLRFEDKLVDLIKAQNKFAMTSTGVEMVSNTYLQGVQFLIMGFAVYFGMKGELSAGQVISLSLIANQMYEPLHSIAQHWDQFIRVKSTLTRLNDIFLAISERNSDRSTVRIKPNLVLKGDIEFKNVWFRYGGEGSEWALKNINFKIEPGQKVAIVGPSGSGKSTIAALLTRMFEPTEGQIFIDGKDYREYEMNWLRSQIGLLQQDNRLFYGTIRENVAISEMESNDVRLTSAAENAAATELIDRKAGYWDQHVPHGGLGFSGGEKQKIALMRLFYKQPSVVILDEATSALDGISERKIINNIQSILKSQTIINIAHRYSTVQFSDFALVLREGRVVGFGNLEHLKETNTTFRQLFGFAVEQEIIGTSVKNNSSEEYLKAEALNVKRRVG